MERKEKSPLEQIYAGEERITGENLRKHDGGGSATTSRARLRAVCSREEENRLHENPLGAG